MAIPTYKVEEIFGIDNGWVPIFLQTLGLPCSLDPVGDITMKLYNMGKISFDHIEGGDVLQSKFEELIKLTSPSQVFSTYIVIFNMLSDTRELPTDRLDLMIKYLDFDFTRYQWD